MKNQIKTMKQVTNRPICLTERDFRLTNRRVSGDRVARPFQITPDLSDRTRFKQVHQYRIDPNVFAVVGMPLGLHELFRFEGVTYKVARVEHIEGDTWEVKGVVWARYQEKG